MKRFVFVVCLVFATLFFSCEHPGAPKTVAAAPAASTPKDSSVSENALDRYKKIMHALPDTVQSLDASIEQMMLPYYLVIADTGHDYSRLLRLMINLHQTTGLTIDSLGRSWNPRKHTVTLPANDEDEIYRDNYFPRRYSSDFMSIEEMAWFGEHRDTTLMMVVAGITEEKKSADSLLKMIRPYDSKAYVLHTKLYTGCMH